MKYTLEDIAKALGVSKSTVSKALGNKPGVNRELREKIREAAEDVGYIRQETVPGLSTVGVIIENESLVLNEYWASLVEITGLELRRRRIKPMMVISEKSPEYYAYEYDKLMQCDGFIFVGTVSDEMVLRALEHKKPFVLLDYLFLSEKLKKHKKLDRVHADNNGAGYSLAKLLAEYGHQRMLYIGYTKIESPRERYNGLVRFARENPELGCRVDRLISYDRPTYIKDEFDGKIRGNDRPTVLIASNEALVPVIYADLKKNGMRVPEDVSVVGFDNMRICEEVEPRVTTVHISRIALAKASVDALIYRLTMPDSKPQNIGIKTTIVMRESLSAAPEMHNINEEK